MKITCDVIKDLMLIYNEEVSEDTKALVDEHLETCEECRDYYKQMTEPIEAIEEIKKEHVEVEKQNKTVKKSFSKIRNRWIASILIVVILVPVIWFGGRLTINQVNNRGLRFTNIDDVILCNRYLKAVENQEFDKLYDMMNVERELHNIKDAYETYTSDENLKNLQTVSLNGQQWSVNTDKKMINSDLSEEEFWRDVIYNQRANILIPEEIWDSIVKDDAQVETIDWFNVELIFYHVNDGYGSEIENYGDNIHENPGFIRVETQWGNYYTYGSLYYTIDESTVWVWSDVIIENANDAVCLYRWMDLLPKEIVDEAEELIEASKAEALELLMEEYGEILYMTDEEYVDYMKEEYRESFERFWAKGYSITDISYIDKDQDVDISSFDETITMHIELKDKDDKKKTGKITFDISDGKVYVDSFEGNSDVIEDLYNALKNWNNEKFF